MRSILLAVAAMLLTCVPAHAQFSWQSQLRELSVEASVEGDDEDDYDDNYANITNFNPFISTINATATTQSAGDLIVIARQNSTLGATELKARVSVESEVRINFGTDVYGIAASECTASFNLVSGGRRLVISGTLGVGEGGSGFNSAVTLRLDGPGGVVYSALITNHQAQVLSFDQVVPDGLYTIQLLAELEQGNGDGDVNAFVDATMKLEGTVTCAADINVSGSVTVQDIFDFLAAYFSNAPLADFNTSGTVTVQDIFDFLAAYFTGCP